MTYFRSALFRRSYRNVHFIQTRKRKKCFVNWYLGEQSEERKSILEISMYEYTTVSDELYNLKFVIVVILV